MKRATISYTKDHLSALIAEVREGRTVLIVDRRRPVAMLEPVNRAVAAGSDWISEQVRKGVVTQPRRKADLKALDAIPIPKPRRGGDIVRALRAEREEGR